MTTPLLHLRLLGHPELRHEQEILKCNTSSLRLLAVLALDGPQDRLTLADLLWDAPTTRALHNLRMTLCKLRRTLAEHAGILQEDRGLLFLDLQRMHVDALQNDPLRVNPPQFMAGHRTHGSERWLEWAEQQDQQRRQSRPRHAQPFQQLDTSHHLQLQAREALENDQLNLAQGYIEQAMQGHITSEVLYTAAYLTDLQGHAQQAELLARESLAQLHPTQSPACIYALIGGTYDTRGEHHAARLWHELALEAARRARQPEVFCEMASFFTWHLNVTGNHERAAALGNEALQQGEFSTTTPYIRNSLAIAEAQLGRVEQALNTFRSQQQHQVSSLSIIAQVRSARIHAQLGQRAQAQILLERTYPAVQRNEEGRARFEWATAALLIDPATWYVQASTCVQNVITNDSVIMAEYRRVSDRLSIPSRRTSNTPLTLR